MKTEIKRNSENPVQHRRGMSAALAFTLVELVVVIAVIALLAALLLPALAGAKADTSRAVCQSNLRQLGTGLRLFEQDHDEMFPPAAFQGGAAGPVSPSQLSWDSYINRYIGGNAPNADMLIGNLFIGECPKILLCPADTRAANWPGEIWGRRTYSMPWADQYFQAPIISYGSKFPYDLSLGTTVNIGVYWFDISLTADFDARSFKTSIINDPSGTLLLVEQPNNSGAAANEWPAVSMGPSTAQSDPNNTLYQICPGVPLPPVDAPTHNVNTGQWVYQAHGYRFNYLMHDGHVQTLTTNATIGTGTLVQPKGMWTVAAGD